MERLGLNICPNIFATRPMRSCPPIAISHQSLRVRFIFPEPPVKRCSRDPKAAGRRADIMSVLIRQALEQNAHNISAAARSLGIARTTLYRRLRKDEPDTQ